MVAKNDTLLEIHDLSLRFLPYVQPCAGANRSKGNLRSALDCPARRNRGGRRLLRLRKKPAGQQIALVLQSVAYLDPLMKVGRQTDGQLKLTPMEKRRSLFQRFGLSEQIENLYPFQLSGGMARRVLLCTAPLIDAQLIIAAEPTPGMSLDQASEVLKLFQKLADEGRAVVLITHDIDLAVTFAGKVAVFYAGTTVETSPAADFRTGALRHPYSKALWRALPQNGFEPIPDVQPYAGELPKGCLFAPRCPQAAEKCRTKVSPMQELRGGEVKCLYAT